MVFTLEHYSISGKRVGKLSTPTRIPHLFIDIQRVTEISTLILTGNRTRQKEQLFYLPFCQKNDV
jgi:hypothetical protein